MIDLSSVTLTLPSQAGPVNILKGIDLSVGGGETVSLVGPSGSGKTSLLMIVAGLERATSGAVKVADVDYSDKSEDDLARLRRRSIGVVFQDFHLVPTMTAQENVAIPLELAGDAKAWRHAADALESVGLGHRLTHYPGQLSGGEQQRTALARAVVAKPSILLADEPTGNLDGQTGEQVIDLLFRLRGDTGSTLLLITHDKELALRCSRRVSLADGRIVDDSRHQAAVA